MYSWSPVVLFVGRRFSRRVSLFVGAALSVGLHVSARANDWTSYLGLPAPPLAAGAQYLQDAGIYPTLRYTSQFASNPVGGQRQETDYIGRADFGATFDLGKLVGDHGGLIHFMIDDTHGRNLSAVALNSSLAVQNDNLGVNQEDWQLSILTYEQSLFDDKISWNVGRTDTAFVTTDLFCEFQSHASCGRPYGLAKVASASFTPTAIWGGRVTVRPFGRWYSKFGVYQPAPSLNTPQSHGFDWSIRKANGYVLPVEFGYSARRPRAQAPNEYGVGALFSNAPFTQPFFKKGTPPDEGRTAFYGFFQQRIYQENPNALRGLYAFGYALGGDDRDKQIVNFQAAGGLVYRAPLVARPNDSLRFLISDLQYSQRYLSYLLKTRQSEGGSEAPFQDQISMELNYTYRAAGWFDATPNIQYIVHPDGLASVKYPRSNLPNALVFGLQLSIDLYGAFTGHAGYPLRSAFAN